MKDKKIIIRSGVNVTSQEFVDYLSKFAEAEKEKFKILLACIEQKWEGLSKPCVFNFNDYDSYSIDDVAFFWLDEKIIGHRVSNFWKQKIGEHYSRESNLQREYYCENGLLIDCERYYNCRKNGLLESTITIPYEKQKTIQKPQS